MLEKKLVVDRIEVLENGCVQVRVNTVISENEMQISSSLHRHVIAPGDDYSNEDSRVQAICAVTHTTDVIAAYKASIIEK